MDNSNIDNQINTGGKFSVDDILAEFSPPPSTSKEAVYDEESVQAEPVIEKSVYDKIAEETVTGDFGEISYTETTSELTENDGYNPSKEYKQHTSKKRRIFNKQSKSTFKDDIEEADILKDEENIVKDIDSSEPKPHTEKENNKTDDQSITSAINELWVEDPGNQVSEQEYAPNNDYYSDNTEENIEYDEYEDDEPHQRVKMPDWREAIVMPVVSFIQNWNLKRAERYRIDKEKARQRAQTLPPELEPRKAAILYAQQADTMRLRCYLSSAFCIILLWLSLGLPCAGALGNSIKIRSIVCLVFELSIMLTGLDIFTNGIVTLFKRKPGAESLIAVSCIIAVIDAIIISTTNSTDFGLPFCGVSGLSVVSALWGSYLNCKSFALNFMVVAKTKSPSVILASDTETEVGRVLLKSDQPFSGFVRTSEQADILESAYKIVTPILLIFSLILSIFSSIINKNGLGFIHTLSACTAISASLSAILGFAFPYYILTKRLTRSGVAIAGCAGATELGSLDRVVITDNDVFPNSTVAISDMTLAEGMSSAKVIAATGSMIISAGLGIASVFEEFMKKNYCNLQSVEDFVCHEGGGLVGRINHEQVYVGSSSFMQLMGIHIPRGVASKNAVYTAINSEYAAAFEMNYVPVRTVQRAIVTLLRNNIQPVFAVKDFNITPMLIKQKFRLPQSGYVFPSFAERYQITSSHSNDNTIVTSMFSRGGLNAVSGLKCRAKRLYESLRICAAISVIGSFIGVFLMTYLCSTGAWSSAGCGNIITFMLLWLAPVFVISARLKN